MIGRMRAALGFLALLAGAQALAHRDLIFPITPNGSLERFPARCVRALLEIPPSQQIQAHGSWYHDLSQLPPYLVLEFPQKRSERGGFYEGHELMFDMRTAALREVTSWRLVGEDEATRTAVDPNRICDESERKLPVPRRTQADARPDRPTAVRAVAFEPTELHVDAVELMLDSDS